MLETIRKLPPASSIAPTFDHMAVDTSWERKVLKKVTWLQIPGKCSLMGGDVLLIATICMLLLKLRLHLILLWKPEYNFWKKFIICCRVHILMLSGCLLLVLKMISFLAI